MASRIFTRVIAPGILLVASASAVQAQDRVELAATVGFYSPMGSFRHDLPNSIDLPSSPSALGGTALGGELRVWIVSRMGVALGGSTVASAVGGGVTPEAVRPSVRARVTMGSAQLLFRLSGEETRTRVWLSAGGGAIQHGGAAYAIFGKPVNYGGVVGLGSAFRIRKGLSVDLGLTTMIYNVDFRTTSIVDDGLRERGPQWDMTLRTGLSYGWR